jgi:2-oxoglutarate dehydrogenase E1 component
MAVSTLAEMGPGSTFHRVLYDNQEACARKKVKRLVLCTGKVYYDLREARDEKKLDDVCFLRLEQLYPFPDEALIQELKDFTHVDKVVWCQEEPKNMGAWTFIEPFLEEAFERAGMKNVKRPVYAGRAAAASTATGMFSKHVAQQTALIEEALTG